MGRIYLKTMDGELTLAHFESDRVSSVKAETDAIANYNDIGQITQRQPNGADRAVANCDNSGNIRKGSGLHGAVLAVCEDGIVYEGSQPGGRVLAHFDGDMYGAAAAAAVTVLNLGIHKHK